LNERTIWIVRIAGFAVIVILLFLLMSLYAKLARLNQERPQSPPPASSTGRLDAPLAGAGTARGAHA
jgi:hypothetical protein